MNAKRILAAIFLVAGVHLAKAGVSSGWSSGETIVVAESPSKPVAVSLTLPAEFVSVPIRIQSDQKNTAQAYEETRQALEMISKKVKDSGRFKMSMGVVSLSQHQGGFGISSGSWSQPAATVEIFILAPLSTNGEIFSSAVEVAKFLEALNMPGKTRCEIGKVQLAIENPEKYRSKLLGLIADDMKKTRETLSPQGLINVKGLSGPVLVGQADDRNIQLYVNYSLAITLGN